jgi:hypothetical protein
MLIAIGFKPEQEIWNATRVPLQSSVRCRSHYNRCGLSVESSIGKIDLRDDQHGSYHA